MTTISLPAILRIALYPNFHNLWLLCLSYCCDRRAKPRQTWPCDWVIRRSTTFSRNIVDRMSKRSGRRVPRRPGSVSYHDVHDDVIKWKHFPCYWSFVRGIHRWPVNTPHKGQWLGALMFSLIYAWTNGWANNRDADGRRNIPRYDNKDPFHNKFTSSLFISCKFLFALILLLFLHVLRRHCCRLICKIVTWPFCHVRATRNLTRYG